MESASAELTIVAFSDKYPAVLLAWFGLGVKINYFICTLNI
jgi:hypothetical protein